jgi:hypothetical protein
MKKEKTITPRRVPMGGIILIALGVFLILEKYYPFLGVNIGALFLILIGVELILKNR